MNAIARMEYLLMTYRLAPARRSGGSVKKVMSGRLQLIVEVKEMDVHIVQGEEKYSFLQDCGFV